MASIVSARTCFTLRLSSIVLAGAIIGCSQPIADVATEHPEHQRAANVGDDARVTPEAATTRGNDEAEDELKFANDSLGESPANLATNSADELADQANDATKFVGQDGRERVVPTGPPPTDREGRLELTFDDLSFEIEKGGKFERSMLTERIESFHGAEVRLRGFIQPSFRQTNIQKFVFVRDDKECCFGPNAAIYDNILVKMASGTQATFTVRPVVVTGQLFLKEYQDPGTGMVLSIYRMKNGKIE